MLFGRERNKFGPIQQPIGSGVNSLEGISCSSDVTARRFLGSGVSRGIATIGSGTTVATVAVAGVVSGTVIELTIYQYTAAQGSLSPSNVVVQSVQDGQFLIQTVGSVAPSQPMPVAWALHP